MRIGSNKKEESILARDGWEMIFWFYTSGKLFVESRIMVGSSVFLFLLFGFCFLVTLSLSKRFFFWPVIWGNSLHLHFEGRNHFIFLHGSWAFDIKIRYLWAMNEWLVLFFNFLFRKVLCFLYMIRKFLCEARQSAFFLIDCSSEVRDKHDSRR